MKAVFEIKEIINDWAPPFSKKVATKEYSVEESATFEPIEPTKATPVFTVVEIKNERVLVQYNHLFSLKGYEQPQSKQVWLEQNEQRSFAFLWGNRGVTKVLTLKDIVSDEFSAEPAVEPVAEVKEELAESN